MREIPKNFEELMERLSSKKLIIEGFRDDFKKEGNESSYKYSAGYVACLNDIFYLVREAEMLRKNKGEKNE